MPNLIDLDQGEVSWAPKEGIWKQQKQLLPASHFPLPASSFGPSFWCLCLEAET